jgi:hypothetical protein
LEASGGAADLNIRIERLNKAVEPTDSAREVFDFFHRIVYSRRGDYHHITLAPVDAGSCSVHLSPTKTEDPVSTPIPSPHPISSSPICEERDACAIIAFVDKRGRVTHANIVRTIEALKKMAHRSGDINDEGDGCGIMTDVPRELWSRQAA